MAGGLVSTLVRRALRPATCAGRKPIALSSHAEHDNSRWLRRLGLGPQVRGISTEIIPTEPTETLEILSDGIKINSQIPRPRQVLPHLWLRDNCRCFKCVNQATAQRNFDTFDIPANIRPLNASIGPKGLSVTWRGFGDNEGPHRSRYSRDFIDLYLSAGYRRPEIYPERVYWGREIRQRAPNISYNLAMNPDSNEEGMAKLTNLIRAYGFVFVTDTPYSDSEATKKLLERIAFIRVTHYGGFYDFIPDLSMADTAYTNVALPAHTDTTYFTEPAGLQAFHLLSHDPPPAPDWTRKGTPSLSSAGLGAAIRPSRIRPLSMPALGGESLLIDGFRAAKILMEEDPTAYKILRTVGLPWHASGNKGITIAPDQRYPVLEHRKDSGELFRIRWNNDDRGVVPFDLGIDPMHWYDAARAWQRILRQEDSRYLTKLTPGTTLIFDNWRVLHGRTAFQGRRRICGGYINRDDFISRWRNTNFERQTILNQVIG